MLFLFNINEFIDHVRRQCKQDLANTVWSPNIVKRRFEIMDNPETVSFRKKRHGALKLINKFIDKNASETTPLLIETSGFSEVIEDPRVKELLLKISHLFGHTEESMLYDFNEIYKTINRDKREEMKTPFLHNFNEVQNFINQFGGSKISQGVVKHIKCIEDLLLGISDLELLTLNQGWTLETRLLKIIETLEKDKYYMETVLDKEDLEIRDRDICTIKLSISGFTVI